MIGQLHAGSILRGGSGYYPGMNTRFCPSIRSPFRVLSALLVLAAALVGAAAGAHAHAGGGLAIDQYFALDTRGDVSPTLHYRLHMGEIASFRDFSALDPDNDGTISEAEEAQYLSLRVPLLVNGLTVELDGEPASLEVLNQRVAISEGETGLDEISIILAMRVGDAPIPPGAEVVVNSRNMRAFNGDYELKLLLGDYGYALVEAESFGFRYQREVWVDADGAPTLANLQPQWAFRIVPDAPPASPSVLEAAAPVGGARTSGCSSPPRGPTCQPPRR